MNYNSDRLIDEVILPKNSYVSEDMREKIVDDCLYLQDKLEPYGVLKETQPEKLLMVDSVSLVLIHIWQNELYAMKFFKECGRTL